MIREIHITLRLNHANGKVGLNEIVYKLKGFREILIQEKSAVAQRKLCGDEELLVESN